MVSFLQTLDRGVLLSIPFMRSPSMTKLISSVHDGRAIEGRRELVHFEPGLLLEAVTQLGEPVVKNCLSKSEIVAIYLNQVIKIVDGNGSRVNGYFSG